MMTGRSALLLNNSATIQLRFASNDSPLESLQTLHRGCSTMIPDFGCSTHGEPTPLLNGSRSVLIY